MKSPPRTRNGHQAPPGLLDQPQKSADALLHSLPSLPAVSTRLLGMMGRSDVNLKEISDLIMSDGVLTGEILRLSNSAMFGLRAEVRSILQALAVLGIEKVKGLSCTVALRSYLGNALQIPALQRCWRHNLATAVVSSEIADWARQDSGEAYTAGILHDIGRLALIALDPAKFLQLIDESAYSGTPLCTLETEFYGITHSEAGEWLASTWGLSPALCDAIREHHRPTSAKYFEPTGLLNYACRISDALAFSAAELPPPDDHPIEEFVSFLPESVRSRLTIDIDELQILIASRVNALEA